MRHLTSGKWRFDLLQFKHSSALSDDKGSQSSRGRGRAPFEGGLIFVNMDRLPYSLQRRRIRCLD